MPRHRLDVTGERREEGGRGREKEEGEEGEEGEERGGRTRHRHGVPTLTIKFDDGPWQASKNAERDMEMGRLLIRGYVHSVETGKKHLEESQQVVPPQPSPLASLLSPNIAYHLAFP